MKIFETKKRKYLEGKLIVDPFTPMVGCTTILEDKNGDVILIALYNFLPDGVSGSEADPIASAKIPKVCTVCIFEPFLNVFKDGGRGIRIDNPSEITMVLEDRDEDENKVLERTKASGNILFQNKKYNAAIDCYIGGLRNADLVPTLLSNRSQAFIMIKDWTNALADSADSAASLSIRPGNKKIWDRYRKALDELKQSLGEDFGSNGCTQKLLEMVLLAKIDVDSNERNITPDANLLKRKGNEAFKSRNYVRARHFYTMALASEEKIVGPY